MEKSPPFDDLVSASVAFLERSFSEEGGKNDFDFLDKARFYAALRWLKTDPKKVIKVARYEKRAAHTMLLACAVFLVSNKIIDTETRNIIAELMMNYEDYRGKSSSGARFDQHPINFQIIFLVYSLKKRYKISPTRGDGTKTKFSGCDVVAEACMKYGVERPRSYQAVKRVWLNRKRYFNQYDIYHSSDEALFTFLMKDLPTFIESIAIADTKI